MAGSLWRYVAGAEGIAQMERRVQAHMARFASRGVPSCKCMGVNWTSPGCNAAQECGKVYAHDAWNTTRHKEWVVKYDSTAVCGVKCEYPTCEPGQAALCPNITVYNGSLPTATWQGCEAVCKAKFPACQYWTFGDSSPRYDRSGYNTSVGRAPKVCFLRREPYSKADSVEHPWLQDVRPMFQMGYVTGFRDWVGEVMDCP